MNREAAKAKRERVVFKAFITASGLKIDPESVESRTPPEPDIVCFQENEGIIAFELVEVCAEDLAQKISAIGKGEEFGFVRSCDPSWVILRNKLQKYYRIEYPVELVCYVGKTVSPDDQIIATIRPMINMNNGQFRRVWLLGDRCHLVWPLRPPRDCPEIA
jgi:hypothetical protein